MKTLPLLFALLALAAGLQAFDPRASVRPKPSSSPEASTEGARVAEEPREEAAMRRPGSQADPDEEVAPASKTQTLAAPARPKVHLEIGGQMSLSNSYAIGNADQWFAGHPSNWNKNNFSSNSDMATGFNQLDLRIMFGDVGEVFRAGLGLSGYFGSPSAVNAVFVNLGSHGTCHATPNLMYMTFPLQVHLGGSLYGTLEPAFGLGFNSGEYNITGYVPVLGPLQDGSQMGGQVGLGLDYYMNWLQLYTRLGYRMQKMDLTYYDASGQLMQFALPDGTRAVMDYSGAYFTIGVALAL